ncbi:MAG: hypothetical protein KHX03_08240 [Clostridium sp.]|nr:hypothetical protein [Clostridium sp.]
MSYISDSSKVKERIISPYESQTSEDVKKDNKSSIQIFNSATSAPQDETVKQETIPDNIDTKALLKKYKKDPAAILDELGIFNEEQRKQLSEMLSDKKDLKSFLEIIEKDGLKSDDIVAAMKKVKEKASSGFFKRIGNVVKKAFTDGISEAVSLAKSEKVYYSDKLSGNMEEIREKRSDFSSEGLVNVADKIIENEEIKEPTMHFVEKEEIAGKKLYNEESVLQAVNIMSEKPQDAIEFRDNAIELESIKDENGHIKYNGTTIINVDEKMIDNKDLKSTMLKTAKKSDMNDDYLIGITDNLVTNPEMKHAIEKFLGCKDKNGKDRFSADNIFSQSNYMVDKNNDKINEYLENTINLVKHEKLSGDNIVTISGNITDNPSIKNLVLEKLNNSNYSGNDIAEYSTNQNTRSTTESYTFNTPSESNMTNPVRETASRKYNEAANNLTNTKNNTTEANIKQEKVYTRQEISQFLYRRLGTVGDLLLTKVENNPSIIPMLKKYGGNKALIEALLKNPDSLNKITSISSSITTDQLAEFVQLCTSSEKTETIAKLIQDFGPQKALLLAQKSEMAQNQNDIKDILDTNTLRLEDKKEQIQNVLVNGTKPSKG